MKKTVLGAVTHRCGCSAVALAIGSAVASATPPAAETCDVLPPVRRSTCLGPASPRPPRMRSPPRSSVRVGSQPLIGPGGSLYGDGLDAAR